LATDAWMQEQGRTSEEKSNSDGKFDDARHYLCLYQNLEEVEVTAQATSNEHQLRRVRGQAATRPRL